MVAIGKLLAILTLFSFVGLCAGRMTVQSLSFNSDDERVADFVQLPQRVLTLLLNDKEDFPDGPPTYLHCEDHEQGGGEPRPEILCRKLPSHRELARTTWSLV